MRFERRESSFGGGRRFGGGGRFGGGRSGGDDRDMPKPVKVGEEYDVEISEVGSKGDGIARVKNFVVFVNGTKQGEKAHIKITSVSNRFAIGEKTGQAEGTTETEGMPAEGAETTSEVSETESEEEE